MDDISVKLLDGIRADFNSITGENARLAELTGIVNAGNGTYRDVNELAEIAGDALGEAYRRNLTADALPDGRLYRNIAQKVLPPTLKNNYDIVADAAEQVQAALNKKAGIGLKALRPDRDIDRENGIIDHISDHEDEFTPQKAEELARMAENYTHQYVDRAIEKNAGFHYDAGLAPTIERDAMAGCCAWCLDLAGSYKYPLKDRDVFQRHMDCRCVVEYDPKTGKRQNAHTKSWREYTDPDILKVRQTAGMGDDAAAKGTRIIRAAIREQAQSSNSDILVTAIVDNHGALKNFTPESMRDELLSAGYDVLPLSKSKSGLNGLSLEEGGGYKVLFGGDGIFRYHPDGGYHKLEYWKIGNGRRGMFAYDMDGNEISK